MKKITLIDLESEEKALQQARRKPAGKAGFKERARRGHYGDLRLLGLSAGFVLLCILSLFLRPDDASSRTPNPAFEDTAVYAPPVFAATAPEQNPTDGAFDASEYGDVHMDDAVAMEPSERTPEQRERQLREMAENIPEGETLIW